MTDYAPIAVACSDLFWAQECYLENKPCFLNSIWLLLRLIGNLLGQTIIVDMWININATNSEEIQKMPLMAAAIIEVPKDKTTALTFVIWLEAFENLFAQN